MAPNWRSSAGMWNPTQSCFATPPGKGIRPRWLAEYPTPCFSDLWQTRTLSLMNLEVWQMQETPLCSATAFHRAEESAFGPLERNDVVADQVQANRNRLWAVGKGALAGGLHAAAQFFPGIGHDGHFFSGAVSGITP